MHTPSWSNYRPTKLGQGNVFTGVSDSVNRGVSASVLCWDTPPQKQTPPGADTPGSRHLPGADTPTGADIPHPPGKQTFQQTKIAR